MARPILLIGGRVIDPASSSDSISNVLIDNDRIAAIGRDVTHEGAEVVDCAGQIVAPGFIDLHVHLREPGHEYKEDIASGSRAAAAGGFTTVCCMPNTTPTCDNRSVTDLIVRRAREVGLIKVRPVGAISKGLKGESLAEFGEMKDAGIVAVSDDGHPVMSAELMRRALEYARTFDLPVVQHAEDLTLSAGGVMNESWVSTRAGLKGQPSQAESIMVRRDLDLVALTGARYHVAHISTRASVEAVRQAKKSGLPVTCEVTPHHLTLTDEACLTYDTHCKCAPPLRAEDDRLALIEGLVDGTIDCIATDHAPHGLQEKQLEFDNAAFGMTGLETAFGLSYRLVTSGALSLPTLISKLTREPARLFSLEGGSLAKGSVADLVVIGLQSHRVAARGESKSQNTPFVGWTLDARVLKTFSMGRLVFTAPTQGAA